jgi:signal transduction histidine kinase
VIFGFQLSSASTTPALLYVPLPFLLWAAARFGLGGLSLSLLSVALISIWYTTHGREPFPYASMAENVLSLQILFCVVAVPLMFLSAVMAEARRTQDSLRRISGSLIEAQEQERHRIGRELHDDITQRLAMLALELDQMQNSPFEVRSRLKELRNQTNEISNDVQALSHELHSSKLRYLGLVAGMYPVPCPSKSDFPCFEFCRKQCTTPSSTAESDGLRCKYVKFLVRFILLFAIWVEGSTSKQRCMVKVWVSPACVNAFGW